MLNYTAGMQSVKSRLEVTGLTILFFQQKSIGKKKSKIYQPIAMGRLYVHLYSNKPFGCMIVKNYC